MPVLPRIPGKIWKHEWYGKMADNENSILKERCGNMTLPPPTNLGGCMHILIYVLSRNFWSGVIFGPGTADFRCVGISSFAMDDSVGWLV